MDLLDFAARPLFLIARLLLWLAWDFLFLSVAWSIGWPILRVLSLGRFPHVGFREFDDAGTGEAVLGCSAGFFVLIAAVWMLSSHYGWR